MSHDLFWEEWTDAFQPMAARLSDESRAAIGWKALKMPQHLFVRPIL